MKLTKLLFLSLVVLFISCNGNKDDASEIAISEPGTYPIVEEPISIDMLFSYYINELSGNLEDAAFSKYLEDVTNIHVNWDAVGDGIGERLSVMLASGDIPDVIMAFQDPQSVYYYGSQGMFLPLNDLIENHMPNLKEQFRRYPWIKEQLTSPDGNIYAFPYLEGDCYQCTMAVKMWIYQPWLDALGLEVPLTTEEFYQVLKAFKEQDPNGNGLADEIPFMSSTNSWNTHFMSFLMSAFIYADTAHYLKNVNGKVSFVANTPQWREGLRYIRKLITDGLMPVEALYQQNEQLRAIAENPDVPILGAFPAGFPGLVAIQGGESGRYLEYAPVSPLLGPEGVRHTVFNPLTVGYRVVFAHDTPYPEALAQWIDWFYAPIDSEEGLERYYLALKWFKEGVHWRKIKADEDRYSRSTHRAHSVLLEAGLVPYGEKMFDDGWFRMPHIVVEGVDALPILEEGEFHLATMLMETTQKFYEPYVQNYNLPPNVALPEDVQDEYTDLKMALLDRIKQVNDEFLAGNRDIESDAEWQAYVDELNQIGVDRYVELWQATVDSRKR